MKNVKYITSITRKDLEEISDVTNLRMGPGIILEHKDGGWTVQVNQDQLKRWIRAFVDNGGLRCGINEIDGISLDYA